MIYYVYKERFGFKLFRILFLRNNPNVLYWERSSKNENYLLKYPSNGEFYLLQKKSRKLLSDFFSRLLNDCEDRFFVDYFKKSVTYHFYDYYAFRTEVERHASMNNSSYRIMGGGFLEKIYKNKIEYHIPTNSLKILVAVFFSSVRIFKKILLCLFENSRHDMPNIIFYKKKNLPDSLKFKEILSKRFNNKVSSELFSFNYSFKKNENDILSLNKFKNSFACSLQSNQKLFRVLYNNISFLLRLNLPLKLYFRYMQSVFDANMIVKLNFKIMTGVTEKPIFIMVNKFKQDFQKVCVIGDSFLFDPVVHLDYLYGDRFYAWNDIDYSGVNTHGGLLKDVLYIGNPRGAIKSTSRGLSEDLDNLTKEFSKTVLVSTTQINHNDKTYYPFSTNDLNKFIAEINTIAKKHDDKLFIIKYKKGEYRYLDTNIFKESTNLKNVYNVLSDVPLKLKFNQFEDLLDRADLLISICFWSTTIWQMLRRIKPVIACNNEAPGSFLSSFDNLEVRYKDLSKSLDYWLKISDKDLNSFIKKIDKATNFSLNGTQLLLNDLNDLLMNEQ